MKRFWNEVTVATVGQAHTVLLDGKPMRLPGGPVLKLRSLPLAAAIADEWAQAGGEAGGDATLDKLNLTRLAGTAQAHILPDPAPTVQALSAYAQTDLLCYRAETPPVLAERQHMTWQPWLDWSGTRYGATFVTTTGIAHIAQPSASLAALSRAVGRLDAFALAGLGVIVPALGSLVLGLAVLEGEIAAEAAYEASVLDETFQESLWGIDQEALARRRRISRDVVEAARFIALSRA